MSIQLCAVNDEDIREMVMEILKALQDSASDVLDIRRQFPEAIRSDTRQLNRVLYEMEASKKVKRGPPKSVIKNQHGAYQQCKVMMSKHKLV